MSDEAVHTFFIQGPRRQARLRLQGSFFVIGRTEGFPVFQDDPSISREHCAIVATEAGVVVKDLGSSNGVVLNGERLDRYAELPLREGDELLVGRTTLELIGEADEVEGEQVTVDADGQSKIIAPTDVAPLDDPEDVPDGEAPVLEVDSDDDGSSDPEDLVNAPTEEESAVSDVGLAEDLEALHDEADPSPEERPLELE